MRARASLSLPPSLPGSHRGEDRECGPRPHTVRPNSDIPPSPSLSLRVAAWPLWTLGRNLARNVRSFGDTLPFCEAGGVGEVSEMILVAMPHTVAVDGKAAAWALPLWPHPCRSCTLPVSLPLPL